MSIKTKDDLPSAEEALAYADGYIEGLRDAKEQDVAQVIAARDALSGRLSFETVLRQIAEREVETLKGNNARHWDERNKLSAQVKELLAERDADKARIAALEAEAGDTTWFWDIVDKGGLTNLPSDEESALHRLVERAAARDADKAALEEMRKALEDARKVMRNAWGAITSNQVADKQADQTLERGFRAIDEALAARVLAKTAAPPQTQEARDA